MRKRIIILAPVLLCALFMFAQEVPSSVTFSYCFPTESDTYLTVGCNLPYMWNAQSCAETGTYSYLTTNSRGCDSTARLHLTVTNWVNNVTKPDTTMCPADLPYIWRSTKADQNEVYNYTCNAVGNYQRTFTNIHGCDSVVSFTINEATGCRPIGALPGLFSVASGTQVYFSKGNLQYRATQNGVAGDLTHKVSSNGGATITYANGEFRFAEEQYGIIGNAVGNTTMGDANRRVATVWIDLFGYGTSGYSNSAPPYTELSSQVYTTSNINGTNFDWGVYNAISNGGDTPNQWRTLTNSEWNYLIKLRLFNGKGNDEVWNKGWARATVEGVHGLIILPDVWTSTYPTNRGSSSTWANNVYSSSSTPTWKEMEALGAVFLPAAGWHSAQKVSGVGTNGEYSSSTDSQGYRYWFRFTTSNPDPTHSSGNYYENEGMSVRLVQNYVP